MKVIRELIGTFELILCYRMHLESCRNFHYIKWVSRTPVITITTKRSVRNVKNQKVCCEMVRAEPQYPTTSLVSLSPQKCHCSSISTSAEVRCNYSLFWPRCHCSDKSSTAVVPLQWPNYCCSNGSEKKIIFYHCGDGNTKNYFLSQKNIFHSHYSKTHSRARKK